MPSAPVRSLLLLVPLTALAGLPAASQQPPAEPPPEISVVLTGEARPQIRLAFPATAAVEALPAPLRDAAAEIEATLRNDLTQSGVFRIQGPEELAVLELSGDLEHDAELYRSLGNEMLLASELSVENDRLVLEGRLIDLASRQMVVGKRYRGGVELRRRIAHTLADDVVLFLTGRHSLAMTSIAFYSDREGTKEIYLMDYDGWNERPITAHRSTSMSPDWSPGGDFIAYVSYVGGSPGIYLVDLATGRKSPVITDGTLNSSPAFSPDGRRIAFGRSLHGNTEIFVANRDGSDLKRLTHSPGIDTNPAWSPNGREIAFTSSRAGNPHVYVMDAEGANVRRISFRGDYNDGAAWSPDGTRVAYASRARGRFDIALTEIVTLETRVLTSGPGNNESPEFSPDGRKIAFTSTRSGAPQIFVLSLDGSSLQQLTHQGRNWAPAWSERPR